MRVTLIDDTIPFDGNTAQLQPLGGAEKAFAGLAGGLGRSNHEVQVFNRCLHRLIADSATWETWDSPRPEETDILVAHRKPELLGSVKVARKRFLWMAGEASYLEKPRNRALLDQHKPMIVFSSRVHAESWSNPDRLRTVIIPPGMRPEYLVEALTAPAEPPHALTTIHPLHGLAWLLDVWREKIHPIAPKAQLHVYSAALAKGLADEPVAPAIAPILSHVKVATESGVVVKIPMADPQMANAYRAARAHLHPGFAAEVYCHTIGESQSCGLPLVARPRGAVKDRAYHGATGFLFNDDDAYANAVLRLLNDDGTYKRLSDAARAMQRGRRWDEAAGDFESHW